jgi:hypothetical protein
MNLPDTSLRPSTWWQGLATLPESEAAAADATAWALVGLLVFCTVCFLGGALVLRKREQHTLSEPENDAPPSHVQRPESSSQKSEKASEEDPKRQPWERGADWWKDQG